MITLGLESHGYSVIKCHVNPREVRGIKKYAELYRKFKELKNIKFDFVIVGFPGYFVVFLARLITNAPIIFDAYISYFDGIRDRKEYSLLNPKLWFAWCVDFLVGLVSNVVLTLNEEYKDFFVRKLRVSKFKMEVLHKGADENIFFPRMSDEKRSKYIIGWWGSFIPLHGIPVIIDAAKILREDRKIEFQIVGKGQLEKKIRKQVQDSELSNVIFTSFIPTNELLERVTNFDIVLGIFADSPKASRCVTNKVYEAMAMGKPIITENSGANREIFTHKLNAYLIPPGDPQALAHAILELIKNEELRLSLGRNARMLFEDNFTTDHIGNELYLILKRHGA